MEEVSRDTVRLVAADFDAVYVLVAPDAGV
jgi:hypothetical protein